MDIPVNWFTNALMFPFKVILVLVLWCAFVVYLGAAAVQWVWEAE